LSREELEQALKMFGDAMQKLKPIIDNILEHITKDMGPFIESMIKLKAEQPWLFELGEEEVFDFDGNDLDSPVVEPQELTAHPFRPAWTLDGQALDGTSCLDCGKPELHAVHDEEEPEAPPSVEELEEEAERRLLRGKGV
jgi:hypothetical protein